MFFFFFFFFLFFWDSCKGFCLFDQKKKEKRRAFFCVSRPSLFSSFPAPLKETKKKSSFFSSTIWREQTNERECVAEIEKYDRRKSPKRRRSIEEGTFPFLLCRFVFLFFDQDVVSFREEREKEPPKKPKKGKKKFSRSKKFGFLFFFFFFLFQKRAAKERRGLQNKFWIVSKTFIAQL